jgi:hypothetical protein
MRPLLTIILTLSLFQIQGQNWIGNKNFLGLYDRSDIVVVGTISEIQEYKIDTSKISLLVMPLKSLTVKNYKTFKGKFNNEEIFYTDIFNGCGYAPILVENYLDRETIFFLKFKNDTLFQIGSMNESPNEVGNSLTNYDKIKSSSDTTEWTDWFFKSSQNKDLLYLLNDNVDFHEIPLIQALKFVRLDANQRRWYYEELESMGEFNYDNEGLITMLLKYKDKRLIDIMKSFMVKLKNEPYSDIDKLMEGIVSITNNKELKRILSNFDKDWREPQRKKMIMQFISKI